MQELKITKIGVAYIYESHHKQTAWMFFLPARRYASAGLCDSDVSGRPSVCMSVTRWYCA